MQRQVAFDKVTMRVGVVQISSSPMCENFGSKYNEAPQCAAIESMLDKIAAGIAAQFASGN